MIKEIDIVNFQSHNSTHLELASGVNVIVGASDSGKSAIIRALRWLIWNRPVGDAFINHDASGCFVNIVTDQMDVIQRAKGPKGNQYRINEEIFKAFGNDVPQPVQEILNLDETNLQRQGDSPFLISATPGEVAAYFNRIAHLHQIDSSTKTIQSGIRLLTAQITSDESRLQDLEIEVRKYEYIDWFELELEVLEKDVSTQTLRKNVLLPKLNALVQSLKDVTTHIEEAQYYTQFEEDVDFILEMRSDKEKDVQALDDLRYGHGMLVSYKEAEDKHAEVLELEKEVDHILKMCDTTQNKRNEVGALMLILQELRDIDNAQISIGLELRDHEERFQQLMPAICPLCNTKLS